MDYDRVGDGLGVGRDLEDIEIGNNDMGESRNKDNCHATIENIVDFDDKVNDMVDPTDGILVDVLIYSFDPPSLRLNLPPGITTVCTG